MCVLALQSPPTHLYGVVQGGAGGMQRQVLERFDLRNLPASLLRPVDGQHVVGELFAEQQSGGVGLGLAFCAAFDDDICCLRWRHTSKADAEVEEGEDRTKAERATSTVIVFKSSLLTEHAFKGLLVESQTESVETLTLLLN